MDNLRAAFAATLVAAALCTAADSRALQPLDASGDASMERLMRSWVAAAPDGLRRGERWRFVAGGSPFGDLMFERVDVAALARRPMPAELAPYAHQFAGDMMKSPLLVRVAADPDAYLLLNKRPDSPLPPKARAFAAFALSAEGQKIVAANSGFRPLAEEERAAERAKLDAFVATLDPALPAYNPQAQVGGAIRSVGSDGMKSLMDRWMRDFQRLQPEVRKGDRWEHLGTLNGFHALIAGEADIAPMGRELWSVEAAIYAASYGGAPLEVRVARGGFNTPQRTTAQAIFVNRRNPLERISLPQLEAILRASPGTTRWGQLGASGTWADRPITIYTPNRVAPNAMSMQLMVLGGGAWNPTIREGSIAETAARIAADEGAIGFGGLEEGGPGLKALAVAPGDAGPYYVLDAPNASSGRYPLTRYMYIRVNRAQDGKAPAQVREFLRYILCRDGQEPILYSGYFPLTAREIREELAKLE